MFEGETPGLVAVLLVGALAASSCDKHEDDGVSVSQICRAQCAQLEECRPEEFDGLYGSMSECRDACEDDVADELGEVEPECEDEYAGFLLCVAEMTCGELDAYQNAGDLDGCEDESNDFESCDGNDQTDQDNVAACQEVQDAVNGLDCMSGYPMDLSCETYGACPSDITDYFECVEGCYGCSGDSPTFDVDTYNDVCTPLQVCD